jgi:curved DNA-binding protein CbpA
MMDCFALLDEPRRPWLDPEALKQKFLTSSARVHPDRVHGRGEAERQSAQAHYTDLNAAYQRLREPRTRLRHLLELERGAAPGEVQSIPPDLADLFLQIGPPSREADQLLGERAALSSPLLKVEWFQRSLHSREKLQQLRQQLDHRIGRLLEELKKIDLEWESGAATASNRAALLGRLEELYRMFGYFERWTAQLRDRIGQLSI